MYAWPQTSAWASFLFWIYKKPGASSTSNRFSAVSYQQEPSRSAQPRPGFPTPATMSLDTDQSSPSSPRDSPTSPEATMAARQPDGDGKDEDDARFFRVAGANNKIKEHASERSMEFRHLQELRKKVRCLTSVIIPISIVTPY